MQHIKQFIQDEIAILDKQITIASEMQASWKGQNESYTQYWLGQKHAFKCKRSDLNDRLDKLEG